jgi:YHS domain-containing protein
MHRLQRFVILALATVSLGFVSVQAVHAAGNRDDGASEAPLAISGYDATVFFSRGTSARGKAQHVFEYEGATYRFLTAANKKEFARRPFRYLPQYAGHAAYGIFLGEVVKPNPRLWTVDAGRLYLFSTADRRDAWLRGVDSHRRRADKNWPSIEIRLARAKQQAEEDAARSAAAESQGCTQVFRENYSSPSRHELIVRGCAPPANAGNATASLYLGRVYAEQYSPLKNYTKAAKLLKFAADEGNEVARWRLGDLYAEGDGVPRDQKAAFKLYKRSAEHGQSSAMYRLARSYRTGRGIEVDLVKAWAWYNVAANRREGAAHARDKLEQDMSAEELSRAQLATLAVLNRIKFNGSRI